MRLRSGQPDVLLYRDKRIVAHGESQGFRYVSLNKAREIEVIND